MEAPLGVDTAAVVADPPVGHTLIQVSALCPGCGGLESSGTLADVRPRGVHTLPVFAWTFLAFIGVNALPSSVQLEAHVALTAITHAPRHGDAPAIQAEVAVGLAHVGDILGLDDDRTWSGQYWKLSWELSWVLTWNMTRCLSWTLTRTLPWTLDGDLPWIHLARSLSGEYTWEDAGYVGSPWNSTVRRTPTVRIGYLEAQFLVFLCSADGTHFRGGSIRPAASAIAAALHFGEQLRVLVGTASVQQAGIAVATTGIDASGPVHSGVVALWTLAKVAANCV